MTEIEKAFDEYLTSIGASVSASLVGATVRDNWDCDEWRIIIKTQRGEYTTQFYTGVGHRKLKPGRFMPTPAYKKGTVAYAQWVADSMAPVTPCAASVLHSLILDSDGARDTFNSWCYNFGYDSDSRKAEKIYFACQDVLTAMRRIFTPDHLASMRDLLQDY